MLVKSVFGWIGLADNTTCPELAQARTVPPSPGEGGGYGAGLGPGVSGPGLAPPEPSQNSDLCGCAYGYAFLFKVRGVPCQGLPGQSASPLFMLSS